MTLDDMTTLRPTDETLDELWPAGDRAAVLRGILATGRTTPRPQIAVARTRRRIALAITLAGAAAAAVAVPALLPAGVPGGATPAAAAALHRLAAVAAATPADRVGPTQYRHLIVKERQDDPSVHQTTTMESWTAPDGRVWRRDVTVFADGHQVVDVYDFAPGGDQTADPSPSYLAGLPTTVDALRSYLRSHVSGSTSKDEAVFTAVGDMLRGGFAPPALRAAAVGVLARTGHVSLGTATHDAQGRPAQEFQFIDHTKRAGMVQSLFFAPATAAILEEREAAPADHFEFTSLVLTDDAANAVPQQIRSGAKPS